MNIIFVTNKISVGGVAIVSNVLANKMVKEGHHVSIFAFIREYDEISYKQIDSNVHIYFGKGAKYSKNNVKCLHDMFVKEKPDVVVNQWGLHWFNITCIRQALRGISAKVCTVYHNAPSQNGKLQTIDQSIAITDSPIKRIILKVMRIVVNGITAASMRYVYKYSDIYILLSASYRLEFIEFAKIKNPTKLLVQTNPVTIDTSGFTFNPANKQKEIVYVGRIDYNQKRVYRVIDIWALLEERFPDWRLTIVGDGPERMNIEKQVQEKELKHVSFEGFQHPVEYYKRASLLILTSEFEGFPLVLAECMSFGVIPVVYGSFSAVYDIIENGKNGISIPKTREGFSTKLMAEKMKELMNDRKRLNQMAMNAIEKSKEYSIDKIYEQWNSLFSELF